MTERHNLLRRFRTFDRATASQDAVAGIEMAVMSIPQSLGYATIAGMPPVTGFYTLLLPLLGFATFGSSRYLVVAADSASAAILAGGLSPIASAGSARYVALASVVALLTAGFLLLARALKLGFLADFLSQTVLTGFLAGVGFQVGIAVLGQMLGLSVSSHRAVIQLAEIVRGLPQVHLPSAGISAAVIAGVFILRHFTPRMPGPFIAVAGSIAASAAWNFAGHGVAVIGTVASGLPHLALPEVLWKEVRWKDVQLLLPVAASCFVMIVTQSAATARIYAARHRDSLDENQDLVGLSVANALAALSGTFVVNGSPTQTAIAERAGARSQLAQVSAAVVVAFVLLFFTHPLQYLPRCVLGSMVFLVAVRLVDLKGLRSIRGESPGEFMIAATTAVVVVTLGVEQGIVLAMVMSLLRIVQHSYHPHTAVLVKGEDGMWELIPAVRGAISEPGLAIYRFGAPLFYANAGRFCEQIRELVGPDPSPLHCLVVDALAITRIDYSASRVVKDLAAELTRRKVEFIFARVEPGLRGDLDRHHLTESIGSDHFFGKLHDALRYCRKA